MCIFSWHNLENILRLLNLDIYIYLLLICVFGLSEIWPDCVMLLKTVSRCNNSDNSAFTSSCYLLSARVLICTASDLWRLVFGGRDNHALVPLGRQHRITPPHPGFSPLAIKTLLQTRLGQMQRERRLNYWTRGAPRLCIYMILVMRPREMATVGCAGRGGLYKAPRCVHVLDLLSAVYGWWLHWRHFAPLPVLPQDPLLEPRTYWP